VNSFVCASYIDLQGIPHISAQDWSSKKNAFPNGNRGYKKKKKKKKKKEEECSHWSGISAEQFKAFFLSFYLCCPYLSEL
jgi:hypothetical protein